jgi:signal transduction histidine kinase
MALIILEEHVPLLDRFQLIPPAASGFGVCVSCLALTGWAFGVSALRSVIPGQPQMVPNTAITFILASVSLWMLWRAKTSSQASVLSWIFAFGVVLIGLLTLTEYLAGAELGFDSWLFRESLHVTSASFPGRPSPHTALNFLFIGVALLLMRIDSVRASSLAQVFTLLASLIALMALVGYVYQVAFLYSITSYTGMALHTALTFTALSVGALFVRPQRGLMSLILSDSAGGIMARRLLPATIIIPVALGGLIMAGLRKGLYDTAFGMLLCVVSSIVILAVLIWRNARTLFQTDNERKQAERALREAFNELEGRVKQRTAELSETNATLQAEVLGHKEAENARAQLLQRLVTAQEEERRRISRELHDQMGQQLAALMLGLKTLKTSSNVLVPADAQLQQLYELTNQLVEEVHRLARELRPAALDDLGLHTALSNYVEQWSERTGVVIDFHSSGLERQRIPPQIETTVYRIAQEALNNVLKHAQATRVSVILEYRNNQIRTIVEDDGKGFDANYSTTGRVISGGLGLIGMQERVALVGGTFAVESQPGSGTTVVVRIPASSSREKEAFPLEYATHILSRRSHRNA